MPLYDYKCTACGSVHEIRHGFNQTHNDPCPQCGAAMTRVFNPAPIVFKGSGFYVTDSRPSGSKTSATTSPTSTPATEGPSKSSEPAKSSDSAA